MTYSLSMADVTLKQVAKLAGVHAGTASRALNPETRGRVNRRTADRVIAAASRLGYRPNSVARGLRTRRSSMVGVLVPDITNLLYASVIRGIEDALSAEGYVALILNTDNDLDKERYLFRLVQERQADGFVLASALRADPLVAEAVAGGVPLVMVIRSTDGVSAPMINADDRAGISSAVDHLVSVGHRRIGHLAGPSTISTGVVRLAAFREAMRRHSLRVRRADVIECAAYSVQAGEQAAARLAAAGDPPTGVVAANDLLAVGCMSGLARLGWPCPAAVSVIGYNDMPLADRLSPPLTTVRVPHYDIGAEAARVLLGRLTKPGLKAPSVELPTTLIVRESVSAPRP